MANITEKDLYLFRKVIDNFDKDFLWMIMADPDGGILSYENDHVLEKITSSIVNFVKNSDRITYPTNCDTLDDFIESTKIIVAGWFQIYMKSNMKMFILHQTTFSDFEEYYKDKYGEALEDIIDSIQSVNVDFIEGLVNETDWDFMQDRMNNLVYNNILRYDYEDFTKYFLNINFMIELWKEFRKDSYLLGEN